MVKKKVDSRVRTLIENGVALQHRSFFVLVGDKGRDQVVNLHYMLSKAQVKARPSVLWCYKKELGFSTHRMKRMKEFKKKVKAGLAEPDKDNPFDLFISSTDIRYTYYSETHKILGNTFGMLVLQDFEALTPNLLARTIETVEGGGIIVILLRTIKSLKQLYTMAMDVHTRFRTEAHQHLIPRFNERFLLSLKSMPMCLMLDDTLDVLPWAKQTLHVEAVPEQNPDEMEHVKQLKELQLSLADTQPAGSLVAKARTLDQATALLKFIEAISEKTLRSTVTLTAARGRGKSATLGLAIAAAVGYGYSNIFVTSPTPENLKTVFEFVFKGFDAIGFVEHTDYEIIQSTNPDFNKAVVRVNIFQKDHRQTIQYIQPQDAVKLGQAELVVIDEAAAIPLPLVRALLGPYLVFMASTINGYEGTGRSLSLKLIQQLRKESSGLGVSGAGGDSDVTAASASGNRVLRELTLETPIRYAPGDKVETWLNSLLCLDATVASRAASGCPHPADCELYSVDRDALFSYNKVSELFLQRLMALYVASHYKNTPNDLQMLSDAPAHRIFCLLGPVDPGSASLPEILCVIQVCLEGEIAAASMSSALRQGVRQAGDLIPWTIAQQFQDNEFGSLSGARVVRIATHPDYQGMGYGQRALEQLKMFYEGKLQDLSEDVELTPIEQSVEEEILELAPRKKLPPLLSKLSEKQPEKIEYLGVSFGITADLFRFWKKAGYTPVYIRQTKNDLTGENTCIMLRPLETGGAPPDWLDTYWVDFQQRFMSLCGMSFRDFSPSLALGVLERTKAISSDEDGEEGAAMDGVSGGKAITSETMPQFLSAYDLKRVHSYAKNLIDFHVILDLIPLLSRLWFTGRIPISLSALQKAILLGVGLQFKSMEDLSKEFKDVSPTHLLGLFSQLMRKISKFLLSLQEAEAAKSLPSRAIGEGEMTPVERSLAEEQLEAGREAIARLKEMDVDAFGEFAITASEDAFAEALGGAKGLSSVSVKRKDKGAKEDKEEKKKKDKEEHDSKKAPKRKNKDREAPRSDKKAKNYGK